MPGNAEQIEITLNGEPARVQAASTVADLLARHDLAPQRVAIEINERLVKRAEFAARELKSGDRVEIVTLVGGG